MEESVSCERRVLTVP